MDIKKLQSLVVDALEDVKAQEIKLFDTTHLTSLFDRVALASGTSNRQTKALAASVRDKVKEAGGTIVSIEGEDTGEWVLVDLGDIIVHIMQPPIRAYYRLEEIWGEKEIKLGAAKRTATKRSAAPTTEDEDKPKKTRGRHLASNKATEEIEVEEPKPARKPRVTKAKVDGEAPAKAPRARTTKAATGTKVAGTKATGTKATGTKTAGTRTAASKAVGKKVKVASPKSAVASAKKASSAKRPARTKA